MKKAFTITEAIISAAMLGVIAAIVLPMINDFQPNKDKTAYNKALYSMKSAVSNVMDNTFEIAANMGSAYEPSKHLQNLTREQACKAFAENFNTTGSINCGVNGSYEEPNFVTTDGMRFWDIGGSGPFASEEDNDTSQVIKMDRELKQADRNKREMRGMFRDDPKGYYNIFNKAFARFEQYETWIDEPAKKLTLDNMINYANFQDIVVRNCRDRLYFSRFQECARELGLIK
jgi:hypothetical protein